jgi:hypothetical protein
VRCFLPFFVQDSGADVKKAEAAPPAEGKVFIFLALISLASGSVLLLTC